MQCYSSLTVVILRMILIQSHQTSRAFSRGTQIITVWCFDTMPHGKQRIEIKPTFISIFSLNRHFPQFASVGTNNGLKSRLDMKDNRKYDLIANLNMKPFCGH